MSAARRRFGALETIAPRAMRVKMKDFNPGLRRWHAFPAEAEQTGRRGSEIGSFAAGRGRAG